MVEEGGQICRQCHEASTQTSKTNHSINIGDWIIAATIGIGVAVIAWQYFGLEVLEGHIAPTGKAIGIFLLIFIAIMKLLSSK